MGAIEIVLALVACFGHVALWVGAFNHLHALPLSCRSVRLCEKGIVVFFFGAPALWLWADGFYGLSLTRPPEPGWLSPLWGYAALCWVIALGPGLLWFARPRTENPPETLVTNDSQHRDAAVELRRPLWGDTPTRLLASIPGNQIFKLEINEKTLRLPGLPAELDGLTIVHFSDLHYTGQIQREFFEFVVEQANRLEGDLVAVTGDIVDKTHCVEWIPATLGRLRSRLGVYGVLGNHDKRVRDVDALRRTLEEAGVVLVGGRWLQTQIRGVAVVLAGDERPWFGPGPNLHDCPPVDQAYRILLAHSPDRFPWAQEHGFRLLLAGHNHGGQIRLPGIGPLVAPSRFGVKYASGVYREGSTVMHVSRGIGGLQPLRFNCLPELTRLVLTRAS